jgi:hypothetical protein
MAVVIRKDLPEAPPYAARLDLMKKNVRDLRAGILSEEGLTARAAELMHEPRWKPIPLHQHHGLHNVPEMLMMMEGAMRGSDNMMLKAAQQVMQYNDTGGYVVRPDVEDTLYPVYQANFPIASYFAPTPARGAMHSYRLKTSYGAAAFYAEYDQIGADRSVGQTVTLPMSIAATTRGATLLEDYVAQATGGAIGGGIPSDNEREDGVLSIAMAEQEAMLVGAYTISGHNGDVYGKTMLNAYYGLRVLTNNPANVMAGLFGTLALIPPVEVPKTGGTQTLYQALRAQAIAVSNKGGRPNLVITGPGNAARLLDSAPGNVQLIPAQTNGTVTIGYGADRLRLGQYTVDILEVPGGLFTYPAPTGGVITPTNAVEDMVLLDSNSIKWGFLGQPRPVWFENSFADDRLSHRWIVANFGGPVYHAPNRMASVRVEQ